MLAWLLSSTRRRVACCSGWTPCNRSYGCSLDSLAIRLGGPYGRALPAHGPARAGAGAPHHRNDDVPRDGDDVLAGEDGGGDKGADLKLLKRLLAHDDDSRDAHVLNRGPGARPKPERPR